MEVLKTVKILNIVVNADHKNSPDRVPQSFPPVQALSQELRFRPLSSQSLTSSGASCFCKYFLDMASMYFSHQAQHPDIPFSPT